ncbi:hypothetical protein C8J56DRAFT_890544 [Mycena floridula]|nr:hypothetical protein C8J56DRAFT_890544 [Mycena floridula]
MPSFSLVRHFEKQQKVTVDSPVSSVLVEQHVGPTMAESSHSQIRQPSEAGNAFSSTRVVNSHRMTSGLVALSQHMEGVSIRNLKGNMMSNNQANFDDSDAMLRVGDIYLEEELGSYQDVNDVRGTRYKGQIMASSTLNMSIWSYRGERAAEALEKAYKKYASLPRLVFHGTSYLMRQWEYYKLLPPSQWITHYLKLPEQSAHTMLEAHNLRGWRLTISDVDETGKLFIADFFLDAIDHSAFNTHIWTAFETNTFIKEDLLDYYKVLFDMIDWPSYNTTLRSPLDRAAPFQLSHPAINFPVYSLPGWNKVVNKMDTTVQETGIVLTLLPNMTIRLFEQTNKTLFTTWDCQANHLIHDLPINIMDLKTGKCGAHSIDDGKDTEAPMAHKLLEGEMLYLFCPPESAGNIYWSEDEAGQNIIEDSLIQAVFGITVNCPWDIYVYDISPQFYHILHTIHGSCGFDPYSTQVAEYLGLPVVVTDSGRSGLEKYMEDSEYTSDSESESGDSNYVSPSEDV